jgi:probable O-glycosylation ligase (exosortase A-associated)
MAMTEIALLGFFALLLLLGLKRPFLWVLAYIYVDVLAPQKIGWMIAPNIPMSLIAFAAAFIGWLVLDGKEGTRFTFRQALLLALLAYCAWTTMGSAFPEDAQAKWAWVWKSLVFAIFLPLTLRTRLRIEAAALFMILSAGAIIISGGIKTVVGGGGYATLALFVSDNSGLYEGSTLSMVAIALIPLIIWIAKNGTIFPRSKWTLMFAAALVFACLLIPIGTHTRTGLICIAALGVLMVRSVKNRFLYMGAAGLALALALPFLPASYTERMSTIENAQSDESASTRLAVWKWTLEYAKDHPLGGGFDAYRANSFTYQKRVMVGDGNNRSIQTVEITDKARAYHSAYFEMLGEQGWPGLGLWLWLQALGLWQMERVRRILRKSKDAGDKAWHSLATALQQGQVIYLVGALFVGIAFQPFIYMLIALQIALATLVSRREKARSEDERRARLAQKREMAAGRPLAEAPA